MAEASTCPQFKPHQLNLSTAKPLGAGAISHVLESRLSKPDIPIAVKALSKIQLLQQQKVEGALNEKKALVALGPHPFIQRIYGTAQSEDELYFVLELLPHGDLLQHIRRMSLQRQNEFWKLAEPNETQSGNKIPDNSTAIRCLEFSDVRLITAQLVLALARVAEKGFVMRDLKPENVAFDNHYRACLIDFDTVDLQGGQNPPVSNAGVAVPPEKEEKEGRRNRVVIPKDAFTVSEIQEMRKKSASFCGTAQYVSPEMVGELKWSFSSDLWALGATVYEMLYGQHLFAGLSPFEVLKKVVKGLSTSDNKEEERVQFPTIDFGLSSDTPFLNLKDFIEKLVKIDPRERLGVHPETGQFELSALRHHPLFDEFDWTVLEEQVKHFQPVKIPLEGEPSVDEGMAQDAVSLPSLAPLYKDLPFNDKKYAEYIFHATADVNPFEKFLLERTEDQNKEEVELDLESVPDAAAAAAADGSSPQPPPPQPEEIDFSTVPEDDTSSSSEGSLEIIDDVGMRYSYDNVHPDFMK